jgi:hypothetical protein
MLPEKVLKVTIEFETYTLILQGEDALKWQEYSNGVASVASVHNMNPFDKNDIKWHRINK